MTQTERMIRAFLTENFFVEDDEIAGDTSLIGSSVIDSTGVLEETFSISVPDSDAVPENLDTIDNIVSYVQGRVERLSA